MKLIAKISAILLFFFPIHYIYAQNIDSLLIVASNMQDDSNKVNTLNDIVWKLKSADAKSADSIADISIELAKKIAFHKGLAYAYKNKATIYYYQGDYETARNIYEQSLNMFKQINDKKGIAINLRNIGNTYDQVGNTKAALDYFLRSLKIREEIGDKKGVAAVNAAIGLVYNKTGENELALKYFNTALKSYEELNNQIGIAKTNYYLSNVLYDKFQDSNIDTLITDKDTIIVRDTASLKAAEEKILKALPVFEQIGDARYIANMYEMLGLIYMNLEKNDLSLKYLKQSLEIRKQMGNKFGIANTLKNLGNYYRVNNNIEKALYYFKKALDLSEEIDAKNITVELYKNIADILHQKKQYKEAYSYLSQYIILKDNLQNEDNTKKMTQLAMQYEFDKKQRLQEEEQKRKDAIQQERLKQQKMITYFFVAGFLFMLILAFVIFKNYRNKQKINKILESKNQMLQEQKDKIEAQNRDITDSIMYAQRIQRALLPPNEFFTEKLLDYFILFRPRDIVSGDFYWATEKHDKIILAAADCTGHGVPGAFMSMLGISYLNEIVNKFNPNEGEPMRANVILNELRNAVKSSLRQTGDDDEAKDGMDMALVIIDKKSNIIQYAGAYNPLFIVRDGELIKYKADKMPVGIYIREKESFTNYELEVKENDTIYMFSDGFVDQFGGEHGKKFMVSRFKELILQIYEKPMAEQKQIFEQRLEEWMHPANKDGETYKQIDDILVIGFRV